MRAATFRIRFAPFCVVDLSLGDSRQEFAASVLSPNYSSTKPEILE